MTYLILMMLFNCGKTKTQNIDHKDDKESREGNIIVTLTNTVSEEPKPTTNVDTDTNQTQKQTEISEVLGSNKDDTSMTSDGHAPTVTPIDTDPSLGLEDKKDDEAKNDLQAFLEAINTHNMGECITYVKKYPNIDVNEIKDSTGCPILFLAIQHNNEELLNLLLKCKPNPTLTYRAVKAVQYAKDINKNPSIIKKLEKYEIFYFLENNDNYNFGKCVQEYKYYNRINDRNADGLTLLMVAARNNNEPMVDILIITSVDPTLTYNQDGKDFTALEYAKSVKDPNEALIRKLEKYVGTYTVCIKSLFKAVKEKNLDNFNKLHLTFCNNPNIINLSGCPLLVFAAAHGNKDVVNILIKHSADPTLTYNKDGKDFTALEYAKSIKDRNEEIITTLENYEKDYKAKN